MSQRFFVTEKMTKGKNKAKDSEKKESHASCAMNLKLVLERLECIIINWSIDLYVQHSTVVLIHYLYQFEHENIQLTCHSHHFKSFELWIEFDFSIRVFLPVRMPSEIQRDVIQCSHIDEFSRSFSNCFLIFEHALSNKNIVVFFIQTFVFHSFESITVCSNVVFPLNHFHHY